MRNLLIALLVSLCVSSAIAQQVHQATPFEVLLEQYRESHPNDPMLHASHDHGSMAMPQEQLSTASAPLEVAPQDVSAAATKSFNVTARQWSYSFNPSPFVVNQGDTVTVTLTSNDVTHGFFIESYMTEGVEVRKGANTIVTFVANTPGTFTFFCTVFCGTGHGGMSGKLTVNAQSTPAPTITAFAPATGPTTGGTNVLIDGSNFSNGATVKFGSVNAVSVNVNSAASISATAPAQSAGSVAITVTNPDGQSATSTGRYTYTAPVPPLAISGVSPAGGSPAGGTPVTITGTGFTASSITVTFGGAPATAVQVVSATSLSVVTPAHVIGKVDVVVTVGTNSATAAGAFTYIEAGGRRRSARHGGG